MKEAGAVVPNCSPRFDPSGDFSKKQKAGQGENKKQKKKPGGPGG